MHEILTNKNTVQHRNREVEGHQTTVKFNHLYTAIDREHRAMWVVFDYAAAPCFGVDVLRDMRRAQRLLGQRLRGESEEDREDRLLYQVVASDYPGTFSLGGDLDYFLGCLDRGDRDGLLEYARTCIGMQIDFARHFEAPVTTLSVVEGDCLGGGFECALASSMLIADEASRFAFPELSFGMFPGMGALALLLRKVSPAVARRLITGQTVYSAAELHELGVVDMVTRPGEARDVARAFMRDNVKRHAGLRGLQVAIDYALPINNEEFTAVAEEWVETAFRLAPSNRRLMEYLSRGQLRRQAARVVETASGGPRPLA
jgi:DSF synthase